MTIQKRSGERLSNFVRYPILQLWRFNLSQIEITAKEAARRAFIPQQEMQAINDMGRDACSSAFKSLIQHGSCDGGGKSFTKEPVFDLSRTGSGQCTAILGNSARYKNCPERAKACRLIRLLFPREDLFKQGRCEEMPQL